jgi:tRNA (guanosine-2'-O-)-methyltransferase
MIIATLPHENDVMLQDLDISQPIALVFGTEKTGLTETAIKNADAFVKIPMYGFTESFNISVSAALCSFYLTEKMRNTTGLDWKLTANQQIEQKLYWARQIIREADKIMKKLVEDMNLPALQY